MSHKTSASVVMEDKDIEEFEALVKSIVQELKKSAGRDPEYSRLQDAKAKLLQFFRLYPFMVANEYLNHIGDMPRHAQIDSLNDLYNLGNNSPAVQVVIREVIAAEFNSASVFPDYINAAVRRITTEFTAAAALDKRAELLVKKLSIGRQG